VQDPPETNIVSETGIEADTVDLVDLTANLICSYVSNNPVRPADLGDLIASVHQSLNGLSGPTTPAIEQVEKPTAAQIKKSITPDALISFEDGKPYKSMKRHLTGRGLTPETYRTKYGLPVDYPMTCPSYSAQRSELARTIGLGTNRKGMRKAAEAGETASEAPKRRGRPPKAD
jgi:predicted transcriptional regulator